MIMMKILLLNLFTQIYRLLAHLLLRMLKQEPTHVKLREKSKTNTHYPREFQFSDMY